MVHNTQAGVVHGFVIQSVDLELGPRLPLLTGFNQFLVDVFYQRIQSFTLLVNRPMIFTNVTKKKNNDKDVIFPWSDTG